MYSPLISVIVPVYKTESYLEKCVRSIVNQTYTNLEIILVDDGSPDNCPAMCDEWAKKDSRIKVIHQEYGGLSNARNHGIACARGEYISFVDSDDWIEHDMYEKLYNVMVKYQVPLVIGGRYDVFEDRLDDKKRNTFGKEALLSAEELLPNMLLGRGCDSSAWGKLYHKSFWDTIQFPEGKIFEDIAIMYKVVIAAKRIAICDDPLYNYYHRRNSITSSTFNLKLLDYPNHTRKLFKEITTQFPSLEPYAAIAHIYALTTVLSKLSRIDYSVFKQNKDIYTSYRQELKSFQKIWNDNKELFSLKERIAIFCFSNPILYLVVRCKSKLKLLRK